MNFILDKKKKENVVYHALCCLNCCVFDFILNFFFFLHLFILHNTDFVFNCHGVTGFNYVSWFIFCSWCVCVSVREGRSYESRVSSSCDFAEAAPDVTSELTIFLFKFRFTV